jgi:quaternary ammonium compound-resistance protein SugE
MRVPWVLLFFASVCEIIFAVAMKQSQGLTKLIPSIITLVGAAGGIILLSLALKTLPLGIGYPIWTGVGMVGTVVLGLLIFGEPIGALKVSGVVLILIGIILLHQADS